MQVLIRLWGALLLLGAIYIVLSSRRPFGYFSWSVFTLGVPAGIGMILCRRWGRIFGLLLFVMWLIFALAMLTLGKGLTTNSLALLTAALGGLYSVYPWPPTRPHGGSSGSEMAP
jgi:hypothetical protein